MRLYVTAIGNARRCVRAGRQQELAPTNNVEFSQHLKQLNIISHNFRLFAQIRVRKCYAAGW